MTLFRILRAATIRFGDGFTGCQLFDRSPRRLRFKVGGFGLFWRDDVDRTDDAVGPTGQGGFS